MSVAAEGAQGCIRRATASRNASEQNLGTCTQDAQIAANLTPARLIDELMLEGQVIEFQRFAALARDRASAASSVNCLESLLASGIKRARSFEYF
jgi:hypothetical protein